MLKKHLPIGMSSLSDIRKMNCYYVDKTPLIVKLLTTSKFIFLSRPRRFGKSLTIDTIAELFSGNKKLFEGLYAENHWNWEDVYPVIRLSFASEAIQNNSAVLKDFILDDLKHNAAYLGIDFTSEEWTKEVGLIFKNLIRRVVQKYGKQVVVLIDEYDKPIIDNLNQPEIALEVRSILKSLYSQLKALDASIRFAMLTGVSKFGQMSLFSGLNHLEDITIDEQYSALCGYTQSEVETVFAPELEGVDLEKLKTWYNGYNWTGEPVYNPFDLLLFFKRNKDYDAYWIGTGGSASFLYQLLSQKPFDVYSLVENEGTGFLLSSVDVGSIEPVPIMFQTGYLTIDQVIRDMPGGKKYTLKFPNMEVRLSLTSTLLRQWTQEMGSKEQADLVRDLRAGDIQAVQAHVKRVLASIPSDWHRKNNIAHYEGYWSSVFYMIFASCCTHVYLEDATRHGRADMVVIEGDNVYIFEFKMKHAGGADSALLQIQEKDYKAKYQARGKRIFEVGVSFDEVSRAVEFAVAG